MKKLISVCVFFALTGCAGMKTNVQMTFPDVTQELMTSCPDLAQTPANTTKLSDAIGIISDNYSQYYNCQMKVDNWIEWYNTQKSIFNSVK